MQAEGVILYGFSPKSFFSAEGVLFYNRKESEENDMNKDLTVGEPSKVLWQFCLPMFGSILFQQLYNLADSLVAGNLIGQNALAAVGNSYEITLIFLAFSFGCNIGSSVIVSRYFGAKQYDEMKTAISTALIGTAVLCAVLMCGGLLGCRTLLERIHTPEELMADSAAYLDIYTLGLPFLFLYNVATGIFSALGDSRTPFVFLAASSTANIAVDILFVAAFGMGVSGVAWATFLCQGVSCLLALWAVSRRVRAIPTEGKRVWFSWAMLGRIAVVAVPSILQQSFVSVGNIIIQGVVNSFGASVIAGFAAATKLSNVVITSVATLGNGISNYASQNLGAKQYRRVRAGFGAGVKLLGSICLGFSVLYLLAGRQMLLLFMNDPTPEAMETGVTFLRTVAPFYVLLALKISSDGLLRGCGKMGRFMATTLSDLFLRVSLAVLFARMLGVNGTWLAWPVGWFVGTGLSMVFYRTTICPMADQKEPL